jgi:transposase
LAHVHNTNRQDNLPEIGKKIAYKAHRAGVADRFAEPAVHTRIAIDLALLTYDDQLLNEVDLSRVQAAKHHDAHTLSLLQTVPGIGKLLSLVLLYAMHDIARFPTGPDFVSYGRLGTCAKAAAGKRLGPSGNKIAHAHLQWAFSEAAALCLRTTPAGQPYVARVEKNHGPGKALTILAHKLARAVYDMRKRKTACDREPCLHGSGRRVGEPAAALDMAGISLDRACATSRLTASLTAKVHIGLISPSPRR